MRAEGSAACPEGISDAKLSCSIKGSCIHDAESVALNLRRVKTGIGSSHAQRINGIRDHSKKSFKVSVDSLTGIHLNKPFVGLKLNHSDITVSLERRNSLCCTEYKYIAIEAF